jgi:hypothetical protein
MLGDEPPIDPMGRALAAPRGVGPDHGSARIRTARDVGSGAAVTGIDVIAFVAEGEERVQLACAAVAKAIETRRGDGVSFWDGASEEQRTATRATVEWLLAGKSVRHWLDPEGAERLRAVAVAAYQFTRSG